MRNNTIDRILQPQEAIWLIFDNNPEAVYRNLITNGFDVNSEDDFEDVVNQLVQTPEGIQELIQILDVPTVEANIDPDLMNAINIVASRSGNSKFLGMDGEQWNNVLGGVAAAALPALLIGLGVGPQPSNPYAAPPPVKKDYTPYYVMGGAVLLILTITLLLWNKKK